MADPTISQSPGGAPGGHSVSPVLRHGPTVVLALIVLLLLSTPLLALLKPPSPFPLAYDLIFRATGLVVLGIGYLSLRRLSVLAREGLRLNGTIVDYKVSRTKNGVSYYPVVRIDDPPFAGREFSSRTSFFMRLRAQHPPGSLHPVLAHPAREIFELNRLGTRNIGLTVWLFGGVLFFFFPEIRDGLMLWAEASRG